MNITVKEVQTPSEMKQFIYLPEKLNADRPNWVPPFYADDARSFDPKRNPSHAYCQHVYALAYEGDKIVGRVAGIINTRFNTLSNATTARFGYMDATDSLQVTEALIAFVAKWATAKGMTKLIGPMGFTEEDPEGFIIEGFDEVVTLASNQNRPSMPVYMEKLGFSKEVDYVVYNVLVAEAKTELYHKMFLRKSRSTEIRLLEFSKKSELKKYILPIFRLMNETFIDLYGYSAFEEHEMQDLANRYLPVVNPQFIKAVVNAQGEVVGFIVAIPNMAPGIIKAKGRIFPLGFLHILSAMKKSTQLDLYMGAIKESYRSKGVDLLMGYALLESCTKAGILNWDSHHELENNIQVRGEMERGGGKIYKRFRIYQKQL
ncbi:MAG: hypothetical protein PHH43_03515 [Candidatus Cloacimonetes bacterium]|nr:hypothetical protein [Candidatus Cloacimonadota bacterium]MDD3235373.1 hypothetical protein [Candidatus Cloacimonadota bacterium]